jgi:hypothetical protein
VWLGRRRAVRAPGLFALYVAGYSGFRVFEETQRIDFSNYFLGMRVNFWIASVLCLSGLVSFVIIQRGLFGRGASPAVPVAEDAARSSAVPRAGTGRAATAAASASGQRSTPPPPPPRKARRKRS